MSTKVPLKVAFHTMGCRSNFADTMEYQAAIIERGCEIVDFGSIADVFVLNSCTVTGAADIEAQKIIRRIRRKNPNSKIVLTGCFAELGIERFEERKLVDEIVGTSRKTDVVNAILSKTSSYIKTSKGFQVSEESQYDDLVLLGKFGRREQKNGILLNDPMSHAMLGPGVHTGEFSMRARYHLRIQDGCENFCTFCIIPLTRGKQRSRDAQLVLEDIRRLAGFGYREVVLTGTHIGAYGKDTDTSLYKLLVMIERENLGVRLRVSSLDPNEITNDFIDLVADSNLVCEHLHICFQAFSDKLLKRMGRSYRLEDAICVTQYARERILDCCIGADLICGFPGESREDVDQAIEVVLDLPISYLHCFPYSERNGTPATRLNGVVPLEERKTRTKTFREISFKKRNAFLKTLIGKPLEIISERVEDNILFGTSREYASCSVNGVDVKSVKIGSVYKVKVVSVNELQESLQCELLS